MYKAAFFVIFFIVADCQAYIDEELEISDVIFSSSVQEDLRHTSSFALGIRSILHSLKKIGFGLKVGFGSVNWSNYLISKHKQAMGIGLDMYFRDCTNGDVTTDNLLIQTLRSLFNGSSRVHFSADYGDFFRDFGLLSRYKIWTPNGYRYRVAVPRINDLALCEGFGKGTLAGGGIGVAQSYAGLEEDWYPAATAGAFGIGLGDAQGLGKGPIINVMTHYLQKFVRNPNLF